MCGSALVLLPLALFVKWAHHSRLALRRPSGFDRWRSLGCWLGFDGGPCLSCWPETETFGYRASGVADHFGLVGTLATGHVPIPPTQNDDVLPDVRLVPAAFAERPFQLIRSGLQKVMPLRH